MNVKINEKINEVLIKNGTNTFDIIKKDMEKSKYAQKLFNTIRDKCILPNGKDCFYCATSSWKYAISSADKIELASIYILSRSIEIMMEMGEYIDSDDVYLSLSQIDEKVNGIRYKK